MDLTRSVQATAAKAARAAQPARQPESSVRTDVRDNVRNDLRNAVRSGAGAYPQSSGFGMPCSNCRLYYPANLDVCPACNCKTRVSPTVVPPIPKVQAATEPAPDNAVVEREREAFLKEFKTHLFTANAEAASSIAVCTQAEHSVQGPEPASICKPCYDRLQERLDVCEAALHMDLKEAAQIIYDAVCADPSDPNKTYTNAASALLSELRKRSGVSSLLGPFHPLGN